MASRPRREAKLPRVQTKITSMMSSAPSRNPRKAKEEAAVAAKAQASDESEDSDELLGTPFQERPASPKKTRPRSVSPTKRQPMDVDEPPQEEIADQLSSSEASPAIQSTTGDEGLDDLMSKYSTILDEMDTSTKDISAKPTLKKTKSKARMDALDKLALTAEEEAAQAEQRKRKAEAAANIKKKLKSKQAPSAPAAQSFASRASRSRVSTAGADGDESGSEDENALVTFQEGDMMKEIEDQMAASDDDDQYNEEVLRQAQAELQKAKARREDLAVAMQNIQSSSLGQKHAKQLLLTQAGVIETAPKALAFLKFEGPAAIDMKGLNDATLPMPMAPMLETLASAVMHGRFQTWFQISKKAPSPRFLTFLYELICLYDGVPENRGDYLLIPFAFDEDQLEKDEAFDDNWRQLRLQQVGLVIDNAIDTVRICLTKHSDIWALNSTALLSTLHHFGVSTSVCLDSTAHLQFDVSEYVPPVEKDIDEADHSDSDKMDVDDAKSKRKKRKPKSTRIVESFPERNLQGFFELLTTLIEFKRLNITEDQKLVLLMILMRIHTDPLVFDGLHIQGPLMNCLSTLIDDIVASPDADPYRLAAHVADTLIPEHAFAKTRLLAREIAARFFCRSENGKLFRRVLSFCFAKKLMGQSLETGRIEALSPSLESVTQAVEALVRLPADDQDNYWSIRNIMLLLLNSIKYSVSETVARKSEIKSLEVAFRRLSDSMKESGDSGQGLSMCKELALTFSTIFNVFISAHTAKGMHDLRHMFQNQEKKAARTK